MCEEIILFNVKTVCGRVARLLSRNSALVSCVPILEGAGENRFCMVVLLGNTEWSDNGCGNKNQQREAHEPMASTLAMTDALAKL